MRPWNLLPLRDRASLQRRWLVAMGLGVSALSGAACAAWVLNAQEHRRAQLHADTAAAQAQLNDLQRQMAQLQKAQLQAQQSQERLQHLQALRQRAQRLDALHQVMARRWPADVQVHEWRVEGPEWRLQGPAESGQGVSQLLRSLRLHGPWQQAPTLVELAASPATTGPTAASLRYVAQGRWSEPGLLPPLASPASAQSTGSLSASVSRAP